MNPAGSFFLTAAKGKFSPENENRLSQVFIACFNHSPRFRRVVMNWLGFKYERNEIATSQDHIRTHGRRGLVDIVIERGAKDPIALECKVEAKLNASQLNRYRRAGKYRKVFGVVKYLPPEAVVTKGIPILRWSSLYQALTLRLKSDETKVDRFICESFCLFLEELGMSKKAELTKGDLAIIGKFVRTLRFSKEPPTFNLGSGLFEKLTVLQSFFDDLIEHAGATKLLTNRIGRHFRGNPKIAYWIDEKTGEETRLWIGVSINLKKPRRGIYALSSGVWFDRKGGWRAEAYAEDVEGGYKRGLRTKFRRKDLPRETFIQTTLKSWKRWMKRP